MEVLKEISTKICAFYKSYKAGHKVVKEQIAWVECWARIMEWHTTMVINSIQCLTAVILGNRAQVLAPHHILGVGMGKVEAAEDLKVWLNDSFMDDSKGESVGGDPMEADD